jgi:DNA polymerase-3 subunit epsilon
MLSLSPHARIVALDLETTGLSARRDRIVELAAVIWQDGREVAAFERLVNPGMPMPAGALHVHGISDVMVANAPPVRDVLPEFIAFCQGDAVVAHNANFDLGFIREECRRAELVPFTLPIYDTCVLARQLVPGYPSYSLAALKVAFGLEHEQTHRALDDARDCLAVFVRLLGGERPLPPPRTLRPVILPPPYSLIHEALSADAAIVIEYEDGKGRVTRRTIQPMALNESGEGVVIEAHCHLRDNTRHFFLHRIRRLWRAGEPTPEMR